MKEKTCLLCGRKNVEGLKLLDCLLCFECEHRLLHSPDVPYRRLTALYPAGSFTRSAPRHERA